MVSAREWSKHQRAVFEFVRAGTGNAVIEAVAGSGKTTTIVEAMRLVRGSTLFLAFNKSIAEELKARGVNARTFHSLTYGVVMRAKNQRNVEANKLRRLCDTLLTGTQAALYGAFIVRLVGLARQQGIGCLEHDTEGAWMDLVFHHDLSLEHEDADLGTAVELARELLAESNRSALVDFDDLLYVAVKDGLSLPKFDFVFVDEAQDTNIIQRALLRKVMHKGSRLIAVGDPAQAIYGFRGADSTALARITEEFNCRRLPLSISYRCPRAVVEYAQRWVEHIEAAPGAAQGEVQELWSNWTLDLLQADDLVVCRTTKPLVSLAWRMLRNKRPVRIMGREIGQGLKNLILKMNARTLEQLEAKLEAWREREVQKAIARMDEARAENISDRVSAILCLADDLPHEEDKEPGIHDLLCAIDELFAEGVGQTVLATIHKAKGLEARRVFWLNSTKCPAAWAKTEWQQEQERNLCYVATTRAKETLFLIEDDK